MINKRITIINKLGLHARAAAKFVNHASHFGSEIVVKKGEQVVNGKSIMGVMMLAASRGTDLEISIEGHDEEAMMADIIALIENRFGEEA